MGNTNGLFGSIPHFLFIVSSVLSKRSSFYILFLLQIFVLLITTPSAATPSQEIFKQVSHQNLQHHRTWLKLLHFQKGLLQSDILDDNFFLVSEGRVDPAKELKATVDAYFAPWELDANEHPRCKYPARYFWLSKQVSLPGYRLRDERCESLEKWALFDNVESVSLLLVSGFLGNPASTFGHSILKFNIDSPDDQLGLFDLTLSYGAMVPPKENALRYVIRGLFGGYQAGFSDKYFYTQDMVYTRREFRDIWDYRLNLSDNERTLLILHIWEIIGKKFDYYFLEKNCAYKLAELLEMVTEETFLDQKRFWYLPEDMFHRLKDIDQHKSGPSKRLIKSVTYLPSSQRKLFNQLKLLGEDELKLFNRIVKEGLNVATLDFKDMEVDRKILILDSLLAYLHYRLIAQGEEASRHLKEKKNQVLRARLKLPAQKRMVPPVEELSSPADGSRPMEIQMAVGVDTEDDAFMRLSWSPFKKEIIGRNSLLGDELVVFDLSVGLLESGRTVFIDEFDLIKISHLSTWGLKMPDERLWSWQMRIGMDRVESGEKYRYDGIMSYAPGYAWQLRKDTYIYAFLEGSLHTLDPFVRLKPHLGFKFDVGSLKSLITFGVETESYDGEFSEVWGAKLQYPLADRTSLDIEVTNEKATKAVLGLNWCF